MSAAATLHALDPREAHERLLDGAVLLDVRAEEEFADGHPDRAVNVPLARFVEGRLVDDEDFVARVRDRFAFATPLLVLCRSGARAYRAAGLLAADYTYIAVVSGGFDGARGPFGEVVEPGWRRLGLP